jgi:hypothetical protein
VDEAIVKLEKLLEDKPSDTEAIAILGRIYKDMWMDSWQRFDGDETRVKEAFESYHWLLKSYNTYLKGYYFDLNQYYPGVNALTLAMILVQLADKFDDPEDPDPEITAVRKLLPQLQATLRFSLEALAKNEMSDYWTLVSLAELRVMSASTPRQVTRAYRKALTSARKNIFFLESSLHQLNMLKSLEMRMEFVEAGIKILQEEVKRIQKDQQSEEQELLPPPGTKVQAFLFIGHCLDKPGIPIKRFPIDLEAEVTRQINLALDKSTADANDYAFLAGAACGGDIIFAECCLERGLEVHIYLPLSEPAYIKKFIGHGGDKWVERYYNLRNNSNIDIHFQLDRVGKLKKGGSIFERNNRWALYSSLILGMDKVRLLALWDGKAGPDQDMDGRLVSHMVSQMRQMGGIVEHLNITKFDFYDPLDRKTI